MTTIDKNALLPLSADKIYDVVIDVDRYQEFLPWCSGSEKISCQDNILEGRLYISHSGFKQSFATRNTLELNKRVSIQLLEGPFKKLQGQWLFQVLDEHCTKVSLQLEFEFKSKMLNIAFASLFGKMANTMVDSFCQRAMALHAK